MSGDAGEAAPALRWTETHPWGVPIRCAEDVWAKKARRHPEIVANEAAIRATVRDPDAVYYDPHSTAALRPVGGAAAVILHYVGAGTVQTRHGALPALAVVVVKLRPDSGAVDPVGYVQTAYLTLRILPRLRLHWRRPDD